MASPRQDGMPWNRLRKKRRENETTKLHELPYTANVKSGTIRLASNQQSSINIHKHRRQNKCSYLLTIVCWQMKSAFCLKNVTKLRDSLIGEGAGYADTRVSGPERNGFASMLTHTTLEEGMTFMVLDNFQKQVAQACPRSQIFFSPETIILDRKVLIGWYPFHNSNFYWFSLNSQ